MIAIALASFIWANQKDFDIVEKDGEQYAKLNSYCIIKREGDNLVAYRTPIASYSPAFILLLGGILHSYLGYKTRKMLPPVPTGLELFDFATVQPNK